MSITAEELDRRLAIPEEELNYENIWSSFKYEDIDYPVDLGDDVLVTRTVAEFGGMEQGTEYWVVIEVQTPDSTQFFRKDGYYQSYDGGYLDGETVEVEPYQELITKYREVK